MPLDRWPWYIGGPILGPVVVGLLPGLMLHRVLAAKKNRRTHAGTSDGRSLGRGGR
jgi:hypothetical protein